MKKYEAYLIDLDGTIYRGKQEIPEAIMFVEELKSRHIPFKFVTNNSSRTPEQTVKKLANFNIDVTTEHIITASLATADYIKDQKKDATAYVIGEIGLVEAVKKAGVHIQQGATLIATNPDIKVPSEIGMIPGNGSFVQLVARVAGVEPIFIGKPAHYMLTYALEQLGVEPKNAIMVGDNYDTDIRAGIDAGLDTLHVQTGVTLKKDLRQYSVQPTYSIQSLSEWKFV
ncbi:HAD-IIA family hydrolase [Bacillaceae bacterium W0354]